MAIKITETLLSDVKQNIIHMCRSAIIAEFGSPNDEIPFYPAHEDLDAMDALCWGADLKLKPTTPKAWFDPIVSPSSYSSHKIALDISHGKKVIRFQLILDTKKAVYNAAPKSFPYNAVNINLTARQKDHPKLAELHDTLVERAKVLMKWSDIEAKVISLLSAAVSLNQAAKAWPEVVHFLPDVRKEQFKKDTAPKVRTKRDTSGLEAAIGGIDRDAMAGELVALRFATA